jgi:hypothetical protein
MGEKFQANVEEIIGRIERLDSFLAGDAPYHPGIIETFAKFDDDLAMLNKSVLFRTGFPILRSIVKFSENISVMRGIFDLDRRAAISMATAVSESGGMSTVAASVFAANDPEFRNRMSRNAESGSLEDAAARAAKEIQAERNQQEQPRSGDMSEQLDHQGSRLMNNPLNEKEHPGAVAWKENTEFNDPLAVPDVEDMVAINPDGTVPAWIKARRSATNGNIFYPDMPSEEDNWIINEELKTRNKVKSAVTQIRNNPATSPSDNNLSTPDPLSPNKLTIQESEEKLLDDFYDHPTSKPNWTPPSTEFYDHPTSRPNWKSSSTELYDHPASSSVTPPQTQLIPFRTQQEVHYDPASSAEKSDLEEHRQTILDELTNRK